MADATSAEEIAKRYPAFAPLMGIPEIADLLRWAAAPGINASAEALQLALYNTKFWKGQSQSQRDWTRLKLMDPGEVSQRMLATGNRIAAIAQAQGIHITLPQIQWMSEVANAQQLNEAQISQAVVGLARQGKESEGLITSTQTALKGVAADYGVPLSDKTSFTWAKRIQSGSTDQKAFEEYAKNQAKLSHPYWAKQLDEGHSLRDLADPYIQIAAQTLEKSPDEIDLTQPRWQRALQQHDGKGGVAPMSHLDWQRTLMKDNSYGYDKTNGARQAAFNMVDSLEQTFGARA